MGSSLFILAGEGRGQILKGKCFNFFVGGFPPSYSAASRSLSGGNSSLVIIHRSIVLGYNFVGTWVYPHASGN